MATKVYTLHISYNGHNERIWREVEVSSNYRLNQLGYLVLAAFDTTASHMFEFLFANTCYRIPSEDVCVDSKDMAEFDLCQLGLQVGSMLQMNYDYGTTQTFELEVVAVDDMARGSGRRYPRIVKGAGRGILDETSPDVFAELVDQIDCIGRTVEPIFYRDRAQPWDYRVFDLGSMNALLKDEISRIENSYAVFW